MEIKKRTENKQIIKERLNKYLKRIAFWLGLLGVLTLIYELGHNKPQSIQQLVYLIFLLALSGGVLFIISCYFSGKNRPRKKIWALDAFLVLLYLVTIIKLIIWFNDGVFHKNLGLNIAIISVFIRELFNYRIEINKQYLNPAQLFIISFIGIIVAGTALLMLPNSTYNGILLVDALFTSTSAVCVTGLSVVDVGKFFTPLGQTVIMLLIQAGGIGIMTFTSYFGYFFKGGASYQNRLMIQDMTNSERIADVFSTLKMILLITFLIEFTGALIIYSSLDKTIMPGVGHRIFFSIFHAVSAFCNAGFSTLTNNFYEPGFRFNYLLHLTIAGLIIIGGIGFPIIFNALSYLKHLFLNHTFIRKSSHSPWVIGINARIVLITTSFLLIIGTSLIYILEYNNTLAEHNGIGKLVTAFFGATTPRTAGFSSIDTSALNFSTILVVFVLMWIGASPGSTGGGIKTSTFAIAILNFLSIARGKDRIEVFKREISPISTRRAFATLSLSLVVIGISVFCLAIFESGKDLMPLAFESVSAFGTVGLSLGITSGLSDPGKIVIVLTMFIGRVSMLTILVSFMRRIVNLKYKYPTEEVLIN
jgi:trk system potassium uptake protein